MDFGFGKEEVGLLESEKLTKVEMMDVVIPKILPFENQILLVKSSEVNFKGLFDDTKSSFESLLHAPADVWNALWMIDRLISTFENVVFLNPETLPTVDDLLVFIRAKEMYTEKECGCDHCLLMTITKKAIAQFDVLLVYMNLTLAAYGRFGHTFSLATNCNVPMLLMRKLMKSQFFHRLDFIGYHALGSCAHTRTLDKSGERILVSDEIVRKFERGLGLYAPKDINQAIKEVYDIYKATFGTFVTNFPIKNVITPYEFESDAPLWISAEEKVLLDSVPKGMVTIAGTKDNRKILGDWLEDREKSIVGIADLVCWMDDKPWSKKRVHFLEDGAAKLMGELLWK